MNDEQATGLHILRTLCDVNRAANISKIGHVCRAEGCHSCFATVFFSVMTCQMLVPIYAMFNVFDKKKIIINWETCISLPKGLHMSRVIYIHLRIQGCFNRNSDGDFAVHTWPDVSVLDKQPKGMRGKREVLSRTEVLSHRLENAGPVV